MQALLGFLLLASMMGTAGGLLLCISSAKRYLGKKVALSSSVSFVLLVGFTMILGPSNSGQAQPTISIATHIGEAHVELKPESLSKSQILANFRIKSFSWQKTGFGSIMLARFVLHNDNPMPLKDIEVTCYSAGPSGSIIDTNTRTVFDVVGQRSFLQVDNMNMGFIRSEATESKCRVTGFSKT